MTTAHVHDAASGGMHPDLLLVLPFLVAVVIYLSATAVQYQRGRRWPWYRSVFWVAGVTATASGFVGPLASAAHESFTAHMEAHLFVGMVAPLLLMLAAPITLALRTLSVVPARRLSWILRSPLGRVFTHPIVAAVLNIGGMWVLYLTPLYDAMQENMLMHWLVMLHFLFAGYLYTVSLVGIDPSPHKSGFVMRAAVLIVSLAAHGLLAKVLYAYPLPGVAIPDAHAGAKLMFYGGDAVEFVLIVLLCAEWYRATGRRLPVEPARASTAAQHVEQTPTPQAVTRVKGESV